MDNNCTNLKVCIGEPHLKCGESLTPNYLINPQKITTFVDKYVFIYFVLTVIIIKK